MKKMKITIIKLGHVERLFDLKAILKWKNDLFEITNIQSIPHLPNSENSDFFLDQKYDIDDIKDKINCPKDSDIAVAIMACRFIDNFYMHRAQSNCVVISLYGINDILSNANISIENFILKQFYEIFTMKCICDDIESFDAFSIIHKDTRGCIFDLNGDKQDIIYNTESPIICDSCRAEFKRRQADNNILSKIENELKRIRKPIIKRVEIFIKQYPLVSMCITGLSAITLNLIASALWTLFTSNSFKGFLTIVFHTFNKN
jgi:hypothetical protein